MQKFCRELPARVQVNIEGRTVHLRAWQYTVNGVSGHAVPVVLLDTDLPENSEWDRALTHHRYGGDFHYRLCQEVILDIGGVRMLRTLGYHDVRRFHMNEGHAALLGLELLDERARWFHRDRFNHEDVQAIQQQCVFTTHTPVPAGHDRFPLDHVGRVLGRSDIFDMHEVFCCAGELNMTYLEFNLSHYVNGVAKKHGEVSQQMLQPKDAFHHYQIDHIYGGKTHPRDDAGKRVIQQIVQARDSLGPDVRIVYLENYDWELGCLLTSGVDVWLNTPLPPMEASGTSGMKAALNGVPSLSVLDGWWIKGCIDGITGWAMDGEARRKDGCSVPCRKNPCSEFANTSFAATKKQTKHNKRKDTVMNSKNNILSKISLSLGLAVTLAFASGYATNTSTGGQMKPMSAGEHQMMLPK